MRRFAALALATLVLGGGLLGAAWLADGVDDVRPAVTQSARKARDAADRVRDAAARARSAARRARDAVAAPPTVPLARCPAGAEAGCRAVRGRIVYVERVDPDGDGDLHVVVAGGSITAPGLTSIDVRPGLRPARDPAIGDVATAAGSVERGSFGQRQVHALSFAVGRRS